MHIVVLILLCIGAYLLFVRSRELFCIAVTDGRVEVVRGHVPAGLLDKFKDVLHGVHGAKIRAHRAAGGARLSFHGPIDPGTAQRLRNIFGLYPISQLSAPDVDARKIADEASRVSWVISLLRRLFR